MFKCLRDPISRSQDGPVFRTLFATPSTKTKAYLRDTKHLIQLQGEVQIEKRPCILAMADVNSLYTIIGHQDAMRASKWALKHLSDVSRKQ